MKKRILSLAMALAMLAVLVMPMAAFAAVDSTTVTGNIVAAVEVTAPSAISMGSLTASKTGSSVTQGNVYATVPWTLTLAASRVGDYGTTPESFAWVSLNNAGTTKLVNPLGIGTTAGSIVSLTVTNVVGSVLDYQAQLQAQTNYGAVVGSWAIPLYINQIVAAGDVTVGAYSVVVTYTAAAS
ncbi:MAG: hypothetical protein Q7T04_07390 [Dehalococcoidia bacterium]|nr:hypothetical protein [Dehalococcoidia bacterium]